MMMLDKTFPIEGRVEDDSPWVDYGDGLLESSCMRSVYDDKSKSFYDAVALGLYNRNNELVGYVPKEFEDEARGALSKGLETKVVDEHDGELNYAPVRSPRHITGAAKASRKEAT